MAITDAYVLPEDLVIMPVAELDEEIRARVHWEEGDFAVTRPRARTPTKIVDAQLGRLLGRFTKARPIVDVVIEFSAENELDPERLLLDAFPLLQRFIDSGLLVEESSPRAKKILPTMDAGDTIGGWEIVLCRQVLDDIELYQVRSADKQPGALKIARRESEKIARMLDHEWGVLEALGGSVSPALIEHGQVESRPYFVMEWCAGVDAATVAAELRASTAREDRVRLLRLCRDIAAAYAELHEHGVLHGDVHERNILVDGAGRVRLLDFGLARLIGGGHQRGRERRAGFSIYVEPEYAVAHLAGRHAPVCTAPGEQYSIAALLYALFTGTSCIRFSADLEEAWRQTAESPVLSFVERGLAPFPALEQVLARALDKAPERRFGSVREFAQAFSAVTADDDQLVVTSGMAAPDERVSRELLDAVLREVGWDGSVFRRGLTNAPTASVNFGSAGIALMLYRLALVRSDADLLSLADVWATRARNGIGRRSAYYSARMGLTKDVIGPASLYHTACGIHLVRALIARAMGDLVSMRESGRSFIRVARRRCDLADLTLGRSGLLLGSALLLEAMPEHPLLERGPVLALGIRLAESLWEEMERRPPVGTADNGIANLGIAHGWGGMLYAQLRWRTAAGSPMPPAMEVRLRELAECAEPYGRGTRWPWRDNHRPGKDTYMAGWCNGSGGLVHLWLLASSAYREAGFVELARAAAWNAWEDDNEHALDLCCGLAGRAYSMLAMYRNSGELDWLRRARTLAASAARLDAEESDVMRNGGTSLYKGRLGAALLSAEIDRPETARMPLFEAEGWPAVVPTRLSPQVQH